MKYRTLRLGLLLVALLSLGLSSCFQAPAARIDTNKTRSIHMIVKMSRGDYWNTVKLGAEAAAQEFNVKLTFKAPASESDVSGQIGMVDQSIKDKADAIILAASSYMGLAQVVDKASYYGIPVISVDAEVGSARVATYVGSNSYEAGQKSAERLVELLGGHGEIGILNFTNSESQAGSIGTGDTVQSADPEAAHSGSIDYGARDAGEREKGFLDYVARFPDVHVVDIFYTPSNIEEARKLTRLMLAKHPDLRGIAALNETASQGAAEALMESGRAGIRMVAFDSSASMLEMLQDGIVQATVIQNPFSNGYLAVKHAAEAAQGIRVPERVDTGTKLIDLDNMLYPENQKLLFPFVR
ncbi:substrate-binding domain-containing protein [Paenibacillus glufosinatiresistens]|uniref:substrate-binding domain-containing protein n=1 Tax=Paenibacillus glufosinatiresistens TaxID=3070657 RepID=UPI00286D7708|nr:substrate-binding domain-containing protein [Paenibacillus sp. YX.27]